jgi:hypothetical protein
MRLEIWKKAQITTMLMIRYFMDMYVEAAYCTGGSCTSFAVRESHPP